MGMYSTLLENMESSNLFFTAQKEAQNRGRKSWNWLLPLRHVGYSGPRLDKSRHKLSPGEPRQTGGPTLCDAKHDGYKVHPMHD